MPATHAIPRPPSRGPAGASASPKAEVTAPAYHRLTHASVLDTLRVLLGVLAPTFAKGVIIRRPAIVSLAERLDLDRRAVQCLQRLRDRHGTAPLMLRLPLRRQAVILDPADVHRVLQATPSPFSPASSEKRAALSHFEPRSSLISQGDDRGVRRRLNEEALAHTCPVHPMAERFIAVVEEEAALLHAAAAARGGVLAWPDLATGWGRLVRRVVFGNVARDDQTVSDLMTRLRRRANWAFMLPQRTDLRDRLHAKLRHYLALAEPGSLMEMVSRLHPPAQAEPVDQIPQWLFAFDPAGMTAARTLALLAAHPWAQESAQDEVRRQPLTHLPFLQACALEALRLWPTTPAVLRQTTHDTVWAGESMPAGTGILIYAPFFHRDDERLPYANRLAPELWLRERNTDDWPLIPFSEGQGVCPGRHLVLMLVSALVAALIRHQGPVRDVSRHAMDAHQPLPGTLSPFSLQFRFGSP